jgi:hypothetical protein
MCRPPPPLRGYGETAFAWSGARLTWPGQRPGLAEARGRFEAREDVRLRMEWSSLDVARPKPGLDEARAKRERSLAERVGFEPTVEFPLHTLSKRAPSTTRTSLHFKINELRAAERNYRTRRCFRSTLSMLFSFSGLGASADASRQTVSDLLMCPITYGDLVEVVGGGCNADACRGENLTVDSTVWLSADFCRSRSGDSLHHASPKAIGRAMFDRQAVDVFPPGRVRDDGPSPFTQHRTAA